MQWWNVKVAIGNFLNRKQKNMNSYAKNRKLKVRVIQQNLQNLKKISMKESKNKL